MAVGDTNGAVNVMGLDTPVMAGALVLLALAVLIMLNRGFRGVSASVSARVGS
jgi:hypothetical protein